VLIPDFKGDWSALQIVIDARPDVLNHNTETVPRLYRHVRPGRASSARSSCSGGRRRRGCHQERHHGGLGEEWDEVLETIRAIAASGADILTVGQYLRPSADHLPILRYYTPEEFAEIKRFALTLGYAHVESGPLVRSSYHAEEQAAAR
jgi:lipoic acid synthetase